MMMGDQSTRPRVSEGKYGTLSVVANYCGGQYGRHRPLFQLPHHGPA